MEICKLFKSLSLTRFLEEIDNNRFVWIVKRLSGNDTGLTGGHQAGLYLPRIYFELTFPEICTRKVYNPDTFIDKCYIVNADVMIKGLRAIYYNSKFFPEKGLRKKYDEFRLTRWGGKANPIQDPENTGSICIFAVSRNKEGSLAVAWVATSIDEENIIENWLGEEVEPGRFAIRSTSSAKYPIISDIIIPSKWLVNFPSGRDIFQFIIKHLPRSGWKNSVDELLLKRREIEFQIFEKIEQEEVLPTIKKGFNSVDTFIKYAHSISNRRKSRAGTSLELNLESIFHDENIAFETQVITENKKKPDFIFPSGKAYHDNSFSSDKLQMLASKTCCKDRWRQILNEADRVNIKHLFTLQQGVSSSQLQEMQDNNVSLIVPQPYLSSFPKDWRKSIKTLEVFISDIKLQQSSIPNLVKWIN
ncbi:MAG TPA: type II restriction endonuclease [Smithella sp.]|nr:type II restriction endonuclease [Smithella sp.]